MEYTDDCIWVLRRKKISSMAMKTKEKAELFFDGLIKIRRVSLDGQWKKENIYYPVGYI